MTCQRSFSDIIIFNTSYFSKIISFFKKPFTSGILLLNAATLDFVAKLVRSGFDSADLILFSNSLTLELKSEVFNLPLTSGIFLILNYQLYCHNPFFDIFSQVNTINFSF